MDRENLVCIISRYVAAFNDRDFEVIFDVLHPSMTLVDWDCEVSGRDAVVAQMKEILLLDRNFPRAAVSSLIFDESQGVACVELVIETAGGGTLDVIDVVRLSQDGTIASIAAYRGRITTA